ncbi:hypothetical protein BS78_07G097400 [Paspalum vaginatum]|nr:hypothetical protein BS78_07G097400 [Paspalum vaginatum]
MSTHMKNGRWSDEISKAVHDNANNKMIEVEVQRDYQIMSNEEMDNIFQSSYNDTTGCKSSRLHGRGYLAKRQTFTERMRAEMDEHAWARAKTELKNAKLEEEVQMLKEQIWNEAI